jgi:hypothetical protein
MKIMGVVNEKGNRPFDLAEQLLEVALTTFRLA